MNGLLSGDMNTSDAKCSECSVEFTPSEVIQIDKKKDYKLCHDVAESSRGARAGSRIC